MNQQEFLIWLNANNACYPARQWVTRNGYDDHQAWNNFHRADWMFWLAVRCGCDHVQIARAACAIARMVLHLVPDGDDRPRLAIEAAEAWCENPCEGTAYAARAASADASDAARAAARAAVYASHDADAARAAARASVYAADAARAAARASVYAAHDADAARAAVRAAVRSSADAAALAAARAADAAAYAAVYASHDAHAATITAHTAAIAAHTAAAADAADIVRKIVTYPAEAGKEM